MNLSKVNVRFPNDSDYQELSFDLSMFKVHNVFQDEVFGFYEKTYVSIKKESLPKGFLGE